MDSNATPTAPVMEPKKDKKTVYTVISAVVVLLVLVIAIWYASATKQPTYQQPTYQPPTTVDNSLKNDSDLTSAEKSLDSSDIDGLGTELDQNDADASQF